MNYSIYNSDMSTLSPDTHPEMEKLQMDLLRQASPARKMEMLAQLYHSARLLALAGLQRRFPGADQDELRRRLADLMLGEELAGKVYGPYPHAERTA